jgi:hypothetical protein
MENVNKVMEIIDTNSDFRRDFVSLQFRYGFTFAHRRALYSRRGMGACFFHTYRLGEEFYLDPTEKFMRDMESLGKIDRMRKREGPT